MTPLPSNAGVLPKHRFPDPRPFTFAYEAAFTPKHRKD